MAGVAADELSIEFLKNFLTETLYLVPVEADGNAPAQETVAAPAAPQLPKAEATVSPTPAALPKLPKLAKQLLAAAQTSGFEVMGENKRGVVILVTLPKDEFLQLPTLAFLQKILHAIGLQVADVAYVNNISGEIARFEDLQQLLQTTYIISFASRVNTDLPHDKFTLYTPVAIGEVPIVFSHALATLEHDVEKKKQLWNALQQVFL